MGTPYSDCYDAFLEHIEDVNILYPYEGETEQEFEDRTDTLLFSFFKKAVSRFYYSKTPLARNDMLQMFNNDLRPVEIEIIGMMMLREYYRKQMNFLIALKHSFSDKDWKSHDKSNQLSQYRQLLKDTQQEIKQLIVDNSLVSDTGQLEEWLDE
jgi:hypothetical protein